MSNEKYTGPWAPGMLYTDDAWLAAYHAHPSVASSASPPVRGDATDLGGA